MEYPGLLKVNYVRVEIGPQLGFFMRALFRPITAIAITLSVGCGDKEENPCNMVAAIFCMQDIESTDCEEWTEYAEKAKNSDSGKAECQEVLDVLKAGGDGDGDGDDTSTPPEENTPPVAVDDSASTWPGVAVEIDVLSNDSDADGDGIEITEVTQPDNGFVTINSGGTNSVTYAPTGSFVGVDTFTYTIDDGHGGSDSATVAMNVTDAPTLIITLPEEGATVDGPEVTITFEVNGCNVSGPSSDPGGCHLHKYLDGEEYRDADETGFGHYNSSAFTISPVSDGEHSFMLYLISNDGSDAPFEPLISDTVTFIVTSDDDTGTSGDDTGTSGDDTGTSGDDTGTSDDDTGEAVTPDDPAPEALSCSGSFSGDEGPECCDALDESFSIPMRSDCVEGEWTCATGEVCTCGGEGAEYECLDACGGSLVELPYCVFGDHFECSPTAPVTSDTCDEGT
jgi:hypothetical protein